MSNPEQNAFPNMPERGEVISNEDFIRWCNRAQAIILCLTALDLKPDVVDKLVHANDDIISAMRRKIGR